ncbi:twitching motility protein PilT [Alkanindiges hydrocarboniclasticus]|uniref:Twitching motility protein PilT n=1 Tax=Alkanindiges hydrocarboniclasticus TaxID=1907941 RepID=A0A1S8CX16_9GAMM|nr:PIN domain-containing protein [Alkanindiges hydrocarboniclasticus]ONG41889.1 twitching motility protein PilT [Alkanindiges hydrocarboniclasticus]
MKVLFDTNIILDVLLQREPFFVPASKLMSQVEQKKIQGFLGATTVTTLFYLMAKTLGKTAAEQNMNLLLKLFEVATIDKSVIDYALSAKFTDFEDAVLYSAAKTAGCDALVTRNIKDFKNSSVPVYAPEELLAILSGMLS